MKTWNTEFAIDIAASADRIWSIFSDVASWPRWNPGIDRIALTGAFAVGSTIEMAPPGQDAFVSTLVEVETNRRFVDETRVGDVVVRVSHVIEARGKESHVVYSIAVDGPEAAEIGAAISADFPDVLARLADVARA